MSRRSRENSSWVPIENHGLSLEWLAQKFFEEWTAEDLREMVEKDVEVDLTPIIGYVESAVVDEAVRFLARIGRGDLASVIATKKGMEWLRKNIRKMMKR